MQILGITKTILVSFIALGVFVVAVVVTVGLFTWGTYSIPPQIPTLSEYSCFASTKECFFEINNPYAKTALNEVKIFNTTTNLVIKESTSTIPIPSGKITNVTIQIPVTIVKGTFVGYFLNFTSGDTINGELEIE